MTRREGARKGRAGGGEGGPEGEADDTEVPLCSRGIYQQ